MRPLARILTRVAAAGAIFAAGTAIAADPASAGPASAGPVRHSVGGFVAPAGRVPASDNLGVRMSADLPESVDLRQYAPAVGDQGQIGSCVAWSIAHSVMGYLANRNAAARGAPYAPLYLYMRVVGGGAPHRARPRSPTRPATRSATGAGCGSATTRAAVPNSPSNRRSRTATRS
jgi:hypothetical protein